MNDDDRPIIHNPPTRVIYCRHRESKKVAKAVTCEEPKSYSLIMVRMPGVDIRTSYSEFTLLFDEISKEDYLAETLQ